MPPERVTPVPVHWAELSRADQLDVLKIFDGSLSVNHIIVEVAVGSRSFLLNHLDVVSIVGDTSTPSVRPLIELELLPIDRLPLVMTVRLTEYGRGTLYMLRETSGG